MDKHTAHKLFDQWMDKESDFAQEEYEACKRNRHDLAASAHAQRKACLDAALEILKRIEE